MVLAAGGGRRFTAREHKLLAPFRGRPVVDWAVDAAVASGLDVLVVTGAVDLVLPDTVREVRNERWADGQATSLRAAVEAVDAAGYGAIVVGLGDQPLVEPEAWRRLAAVDAPLAYATYGGRRGNPVRLARQVWPSLPTEGDEGARGLLRRRPDAVPVACPGDPLDIDTPEDLAPWS